MKSQILLALTLGSFLTASSGMAAAGLQYKVVPKSGIDTGIRFDVPYTAGIHHGFSKEVTGDILINLNPIEAQSVSLKVPVASMTTGDTTRDCHMREALGIDYTHSQFPANHICNNAHELPATGPDSVVYPNIELTILNIANSASQPQGQALLPGKPADVKANVRLTIHGVTKDLAIPLKIEAANSGVTGAFHVTSTFPVLLADFGIVVKPFLAIKVKGNANIKIDLQLEPK